MVCGKEDVKIHLKDEKVAEYLCLFGFENIIKLETGKKTEEIE